MTFRNFEGRGKRHHQIRFWLTGALREPETSNKLPVTLIAILMRYDPKKREDTTGYFVTYLGP
jgi:hypothetical protein